MKRSITTYVLMFLILFQVISAVPSGLLMIIDPSGEKLGLPIKLLQDTPFPDFLIPALFLFLVLGVFPGIVLYGLIKKKHFSTAEKLNLYKNHHWAWTFSYYVGLLLIMWINMQLFFIKSFDIAHFVYSMLGVAIIMITHLPSTKRDYEI